MLPDFLNSLFFVANTTAALQSTKYNVTLTTGPLTDFTRHDPSNPTPQTLMLSIFQPSTCEHTIQVPYMPPQTAALQGPLLQNLYQIPPDTSIFSNARLTVCSNHTSSINILPETPILLFSPGYTIPRLHYNHLAMEISQKGFTVITIDHPFDTNIIIYPSDNSTILNSDISQNPTAWKEHLPARVADTHFLINQLSNRTAMSTLLPHYTNHSFQTNRIGMLGHSLGGVTAVIAASQDCRILAAINWDGTFVTQPSDEQGTKQPVLLIARDSDSFDGTWPATWPLLTGMKLWVKIKGATHMSFSDVAGLMQRNGRDLGEFEEGLERVEPGKMRGILVRSAVDWMEGVFEGEMGGTVLDGMEGVETVLGGNF